MAKNNINIEQHTLDMIRDTVGAGKTVMCITTKYHSTSVLRKVMDAGLEVTAPGKLRVIKMPRKYGASEIATAMQQFERDTNRNLDIIFFIGTT